MTEFAQKTGSVPPGTAPAAHGTGIAPCRSMTLRQAVASARDLLAQQPDLSPTAARDAELLLLQTLGIPRTTLLAYPGRLLNAEEQASYFSAIDRRLRREPVQYITGSQEFFGLRFAVSPAVLIPRPETEHLVEAVLARVPADRDLRLADVGTGSGILAITLAMSLPRAQITALDLSPAALAMARQNAETHGVAGRIAFLRSDLFSGLPAGERAFDAIVSNPPYVAETERSSLHAEVRDFEPAEALFAGADGLEVYRRLIPAASDHLVPSGLLALEIGAGQRRAIELLLRGWNAVQTLPDLRRIPRVTLARRR